VPSLLSPPVIPRLHGLSARSGTLSARSTSQHVTTVSALDVQRARTVARPRDHACSRLYYGHIMSGSQRRICVLCGRAYAIVRQPDEPERETDKLCHTCASLPPPPEEPSATVPTYGVQADRLLRSDTTPVIDVKAFLVEL
jgi:hypothetical protein